MAKVLISRPMGFRSGGMAVGDIDHNKEYQIELAGEQQKKYLDYYRAVVFKDKESGVNLCDCSTHICLSIGVPETAGHRKRQLQTLFGLEKRFLKSSTRRRRTTEHEMRP